MKFINDTGKAFKDGFNYDVEGAKYGLGKLKRGNEMMDWKKTGKNLGVAVGGDMGHQYERALINAGVNREDAGTTGRVIDWAYGGATFGTAPIIKAGVDDARQRRAKKQRKNRKKKAKQITAPLKVQ